MVRLGVHPGKVAVTGNLKHAPWDDGCLDKGALNFYSEEGSEARPVVVAGSTHRGEEDLLLEAFLALKIQFPALQMVLAPRHPHRFAEVDRLLRRKGIRYQRQSQKNGRRGQPPEVIFLDTLGDLPAFYAFADIAFVGGSLVDAGGHNLMEPARCRKPIVFGPHMRNFSHVARELKEPGGAIEVRGAEDLTQRVSELLHNPGKAAEMGEIAFQVVKGDRGVVERSLALVGRYLEKNEGASPQAVEPSLKI
jgi:3-deoxy-D-manno-octulosonic-acid transferase